MRLYLKLLLLFTLLTIAGFKLLTATEAGVETREAKQHLLMPEGPDLRNPGYPYNPGTNGTSLSTSGWFDRSGTEWN